MKHGFIKVASATPEVRVADVKFNTEKTIEMIREADPARRKACGLP